MLVLSDEIVAIGLSQRTTVAGIEQLARNILIIQRSGRYWCSTYQREERSCTWIRVFTMVDFDKFTIHPR